MDWRLYSVPAEMELIFYRGLLVGFGNEFVFRVLSTRD